MRLKKQGTESSTMARENVTVVTVFQTERRLNDVRALLEWKSIYKQSRTVIASGQKMCVSIGLSWIHHCRLL